MPVIWHTVLTGKFCHKFENKDTIFQMEVVLIMLLKLKNDFAVDRIDIRLNTGCFCGFIRYFRGAVPVFLGVAK